MTANYFANDPRGGGGGAALPPSSCPFAVEYRRLGVALVSMSWPSEVRAVSSFHLFQKRNPCTIFWPDRLARHTEIAHAAKQGIAGSRFHNVLDVLG